MNGDAGERGYQRNFSSLYGEASYNAANRVRKAETLLAILREECGGELADKRLLDIGASLGFIAEHLAAHVGHVTGLDIDGEAIAHAQKQFSRDNLEFRVGDAMETGCGDGSIDIVVCTHIYEHVPDDTRMMAEIRRILAPGGLCYFTAGNRYQLMEPHYRLPLLSVMPRSWADRYLRLLGRGERYYEKHRSYAGLKELVRGFDVNDYTLKAILEPERYRTSYMVPPGSIKQRLASFIVRHFYRFCPTYIWVLRPAGPATGQAA